MAARGATTEVGHAQIAGIDESNKVGSFPVEQRIGPDGIGGRMPDLGVQRLHMGFLLGHRDAVSSVAVSTTNLQRIRSTRLFMGIAGVFMALNTSLAFGKRQLRGLTHEVNYPLQSFQGNGFVFRLNNGLFAPVGTKSPERNL